MSTATGSTNSNMQPQRKVGFLLGLGILLLPWIFGWFTLRSGYSLLARILSIGWGTLVLLIVMGNHNAAPAGGLSATPAAASSSTLASSTAVADADVDRWSYSEDKDDMRGGSITRHAVLESDDEQTFSFPYKGGKASLELRKSPKFGTDVIISINGQFICNELENSNVDVKFDGRAIEHFSCSEPSDGSVGVLFIRSSSRFISELKRSKKLTIEAQFFQEGVHQMNWSVEGLKWN